MPVGGPNGKRRVLPYNAHVTKDREEKYHTRKRTFAKYQRFQRFEERQQGEHPAREAGPTRGMALVADSGTHEDEYERRLAFSFGDAAPSEKHPRSRKKKRPDATTEAPSAEDTNDNVRRDSGNKSKRRNIKVSDALANDQSDLGKSKRRKIKVPSAVADDQSELGANAKKSVQTTWEETTTGKASHGRKKAAGPRIANRFTKDLNHYLQAEEVKAAERRRVENEIRERKQKRKDHGRDRAMMGKMLAQRNSRGQPRMQSRLDALTSKLLEERGRSSGK